MINIPHVRVHVQVVLMSLLPKYCTFSVGFKEGMVEKNGIGLLSTFEIKMQCQMLK